MSVFPGSLDSDATLYVARDNIQTTLNAPMGISDNVAVLVNPAGWAPNMIASIESEQVLVTSVTGNLAQITRAFNGTTAASHSQGVTFSNFVNAAYQSSAKAAIIAIETALGVNLNNTSGPESVASNYDFAHIAPPENLSPSARVATLAPVPLGVNGGDSRHYLGIYNNAGAFQEAVLINGGTAVSGGGGFVTFASVVGTYASGAYKIGSASAGIAEAYQTLASSAAGGGRVLIKGAVTHVPIYTINGAPLDLIGPTRGIYAIKRSPEFTGSSMFIVDNAFVSIRHMTIFQGSGSQFSGAIGISLSAGGSLFLDDMVLYNGNIGVLDNGGNQLVITDSFISLVDQSFKAEAALAISGSANNVILTSSSFGGSPDGANLVSYGILLQSCDGVEVTNCGITADSSVYIDPVSPAFVANVHFVGCLLDGFRTYGVALVGSGGSGEIRFIGCHIHGQAQNGWSATGPALYIQTAGAATAIEITGGALAGSNSCGLIVQQLPAGSNLKLTGVTMFGNNAGNAAGIPAVFVAAGVSGLDFTCNTVYNGTAGIAGHQTYAFQTAGPLSGSVVSGNNFLHGGITGPMLLGGTFSGIMKNNLGVDLQSGVGAVLAVSGNAIAPTNEAHHVGAGLIKNITLPPGFLTGALSLIPDAAFTTDTTGNISKASTAVVGQAMTAYYDGAKWALSY